MDQEDSVKFSYYESFKSYTVMNFWVP